MTLDEFFEKLPRTNWYLDANGKIRTFAFGSPCLCPIERLVPHMGVFSAARALGLDYSTRRLIIGAADNAHGHDPTLRARLLAHCGLTEGAR